MAVGVSAEPRPNSTASGGWSSPPLFPLQSHTQLENSTGASRDSNASSNYSLAPYLSSNKECPHSSSSSVQSIQPLAVTQHPAAIGGDSSAAASPEGKMEDRSPAAEASSAAEALSASTPSRLDALVEDEVDGAVSYRQMDEHLSTKPALEVMEMGFSADVVHTVIQMKLVETGENYVAAQELLDAVLAYQATNNDNEYESDSVGDENRSSDRPKSDQAKKTVRNRATKGAGKAPDKVKMQRNEGDLCTDGEDAGGKLPGLGSTSAKHRTSSFELKQENTKMKSERLCKICLEKEVRIVLLPCGHLASCSDCASLLTRCPICQRAVKGSVKVFLV